MAIGGKLLCGVAVLSVAACAGQQGELTIRATSSPLAAESRPVPARIAEARAQLLLGNVGLALESFRIAARDDPSSSEALAGLAESYDRMRRFDLSRRYYEAALAIAPADAGLLERLAVSLERQRKPDEAAEVRREIAMRRELAATPSVAEPAAAPVVSAQIAAPAQTVTVPLALAPQAMTLPEPVAIAREQERPAPASPPAEPKPVVAAAVAPAPTTLPAAPRPSIHVAAAPAVAAPPPAPVAAAPLVAFSEARPDVLARVPAASAADPRPLPEQPLRAAPTSVGAASVTVELPPARPAPAQAQIEPPSKRPEAKPQLARVGGEPPRLERLSLAEVALVTKDAPLWQPRIVAQSNRSTTIRFVPLKQHSQATASVRLLNAARSHRLAAHTRDYLSGMGWRRIAIGDADEIRETSIIYYPESRRRTAEILAAQFRIRVLRRAGEDSAIVMLLGRDAARTRSRRTSA